MSLADQIERRYFVPAAFVASVAGLVSIAASHICLGLSAALLVYRCQLLRVPPIIWPVVGFMLWTVASTVASSDPSAAGPQLKKFFVFLMIPVVFSAFRTVETSRKLAQAWFVAAAIAVVVAIFQFVQSMAAIRASGQDFNSGYLVDRITGFFSHWMTFSQAGLLVFVILVSYILFANRRAGHVVWVALAAVIAAGLVLSYTRSVWLAMAIVATYFTLIWRPKLLLLGPVVLAAGYFLAPPPIQQRVASMNVGANQPRIIMWRTGLRMIDAHPVFGVGPQQVGPRFSEFQPADITELPPAYYEHLHNVYIHYAAERGIPATLIVLWIFGLVLWNLSRALRTVPDVRGDRRFLLHAGIAGTIAMMVVSCFDVSMGDSEVLGAYLGLVSIAYNGVSAGTAAT